MVLGFYVYGLAPHRDVTTRSWDARQTDRNFLRYQNLIHSLSQFLPDVEATMIFTHVLNKGEGCVAKNAKGRRRG